MRFALVLVGLSVPALARTASQPAAAIRTHAFDPTQFQHFFSGKIDPVLHINPGDT